MNNSMNMNTMTRLAIGMISAGSLAANAGGITSWNNGAGGDWGLGANWSTGLVPTASDPVSIGLPGAYTVDLVGSRAAGSLSISNMDAILDLQFGSTLNMSGNLDNLGSIEINTSNVGATTTFSALTDVTLGGSGRMYLGGPGSRARIQTLNGSTLNHASNHTIEGLGQITALLQNNGLVSANINEGQMQLNSNDKTNLGTFEAVNGGIMEISGTSVSQLAGGEIVADGAGSQIELLNATINGGMLTSLNGADIELTGNNTLNNVDFAGLLNIQFNATLHLGGTWTNNGAVVLNPSQVAATTTIDVDSTLTFNGNGSLHLTSANTLSRLRTADGAVLTQGPSHTIFGLGQIEADLVNNGLVSADSDGGQMRLNVNDKINNATFEAVGGGIMEINGITVTQGSGGQIIADGAGSQIELSNATVIGGDLLSVDTADVEIIGSSELSGVNSESLINIPFSSTLRISDSWTNNGTVVVNSNQISATTTLFFEDSMTIGGSGEIELTRPSTLARIQGDNGVAVTQNPDHTIFGLGQIEATLINDGLVSANAKGAQMALNVNDKTNNATMQAVDGGILEINGVTVDQSAGGEVIADGVGSQIELVNATIIGGDLQSMNGADIEVTGISTLDGVFFDGLMNIPHANTVNIANSIESNGVIVLNSTPASSTTTLNFTDSSSLMGTGSLVLTSSNTLSRLTTAPDQVMTHAAGHTIEGRGQIEADMVNNGLISANSTSGQMIQNAKSKVNNSTMEAVNGGILEFSGITITQGPGGEIVADGTDSQVELTNTTVVGGTLVSQNDADIESTGTSTLEGVSFSGVLNLPHANILAVMGGVTNDGLIIVNSTSASSTTTLRWDEEFTLEGSGTIRLTRSNTLSQLTAIGGKVNQGGLGSGQRLEGVGLVGIDLAMDGTLAPGLSIGTMSATQPIDLSGSASFEAEINGSGGDLLDSSSSVDLEGTLDVLFIDGFAPAEFWVRTIIEGSDITGSFDTVNAPAAPGSFVTRVVNTGTKVMIGQTCKADLTLDGALDFFDVSDFLDKFAAKDPEVDFTNDGEFDFFDVSDFLDAFGAGCNP
tara:strand:- start:8146 stop:11340 length:3195 start_codon:yes stop_codon:yes gene_type:complete